jgi:farnesyl diphosphate synthase
LPAFLETLRALQARVEQALDARLPSAAAVPERLHQAMRYATLSNGKRVRAALAYAAGRAFGATDETLDTPACALELIHAYSLVHDDLPCMDDDDLRRGQATCHKAFDEATALLAGDALQTLAFEILATDKSMSVSDVRRAEMIGILARAAGSFGMGGGQAIDLESTGKIISAETLKDMHARKTGALIEASVLLGALAGTNDCTLALGNLRRCGAALGLAFQIMDDILDVESDTKTLGKTAGADVARQKPTYPAIMGMDKAKQLAQELKAQALESLKPLGDNAALLRNLSLFIVERRQ